jgi:hypothetical protein
MKRKVRDDYIRKARCDSYRAQLAEEERKQLYQWLLEPGLPLDEVVRRAPPWRVGRWAGTKPGRETIAKIGRQLRVESTLAEIEDVVAVYEAAMAKMFPNLSASEIHERILNSVMGLLAQRVLGKTVNEKDPRIGTDAARLMLKRSDQFFDREKFAFIVRKYEEEAHALKLSEEQARQEDSRHRGIPEEVMEQIEKELRLL